MQISDDPIAEVCLCKDEDSREQADINVIWLKWGTLPPVDGMLLYAEPPGEVVVTWNESRTEILAVTRQDKDGQVLSTIAIKPGSKHAQG